MKNKNPSKQRSSECWAHFRFSVVGALLAAPPGRGELQQRLAELAAKAWRHPISGDWFRLGLSTIERWYYAARNEPKSPVDVLQRKIRKDQGTHWAVNARQSELIHAQYHQHPNWSYQLHCDNLAALINAEPDLGKAPSYPSVLRYMKTHGLIKRPRRGPVSSPGAVQAELRFESREVRSYESAFVNALWHLDFHHGSLRVLLPQGKYAYPLLLAVMDDRSRLCAHAQWYLSEGAEELVHGLCQALEKRGLPRALMHDNGSAMIAAETEQGLKRLSILQENTLPHKGRWIIQSAMRFTPFRIANCSNLCRLDFVKKVTDPLVVQRIKIHLMSTQSVSWLFDPLNFLSCYKFRINHDFKFFSPQ